ncbi:hypothetical protein WICPIJ_007983 [Wickerhamomyces pijperi]|uniref:Ebp2p n=1 Tax=Wickerhamomyces pijperi TaxID=599730 RepID=A0A9P8Q1F0_WICPI|nr:hypothetical protein WICPIJ_007983 [Wickerhamomyces pijperi]
MLLDTMGKGKLKESLHNKKVIDKAEKAKQKKESQQKEKSEAESSGPKTVSKEDLEAKLAAEQANIDAEAAAAEAEKEEEEKDASEYQSNALSKKDRRKLKKAVESKLEAEEEQEEGSEADDDDEEEDSEMEEYLLDLEKLARSDDEEDDSEEDEDEEEEAEEEEAEEEEAEEEQEDVAYSDVEVDSDADVVPHSKLTINNVAALNNALKRIELPWAKHSFQEHQSITSTEKVEPQIKDIYDDTERELAFYKQALDATLQGRSRLLKLKVPFTRPDDYFAEMIKSDEHMDKLKNKLIKEASEKKAAVEARRQRDLKKFGKQVQNQTLQQRAKDKKETLDKIKSLKRKRQNDEMTGDAFDIALEEATADQDERKDRQRGDKRAKPNAKRMAKNSKYGQGGMKRFKRKNDAESSADVSDFSHRKMKGKASKRPESPTDIPSIPELTSRCEEEDALIFEELACLCDNSEPDFNWSSVNTG